MRILLMCHALTGGGAERVCAGWANGLSRAGHEVSILTDTVTTPQTYRTVPEVAIVQCRFRPLRSGSILARIRNRLSRSWSFFKQIRRLIKEDKPDAIVNVLYYAKTELLLAKLCAMSKVPIIMTDHNAYERPKGVRMPIWQWMCKFVYNRFFDRVTVLTRPDKEILERRGIRNADVLHNPLFLAPSTEWGGKEKTVLSVGRINAWYVKGFDLLVEAWNEIASRHGDWKLRIVGSGDEEVKRMLLDRYDGDIGNIEFKPFTEDIVEEYRKASIFVLSSRFEGWGLTLVEAMSQHCACVACDYKGRQAEIIENGKNGLLCRTDDARELAAKIEALISDDALRERLQEASAADLDRFSEEEVARNLERIILKACRR